jgi:hypothetical protein
VSSKGSYLGIRDSIRLVKVFARVVKTLSNLGFTGIPWHNKFVFIINDFLSVWSNLLELL